MTRLTFSSVQQYALDCGYETVKTSRGYFLYPKSGNLVERIGGYKAKTLAIVMDVIKEGHGLDGEYRELPHPSNDKPIYTASSTNIPMNVSCLKREAMATFAKYAKHSIDDVYRYYNATSIRGYILTNKSFNLECSRDFRVRGNSNDFWKAVIKWCFIPEEDTTKEALQQVELTPSVHDCDFYRKPNCIIDFFCLAFTLKVAATVIELYCAEISKECNTNNTNIEGWVNPDSIGTQAMRLGFDVNDLFGVVYCGYYDDMPEFYYDCLNACITTIQPIIRDEGHDWFCDAIEMFSESEEKFNTRIILEEIYRSPEVMEPLYWDTSKNTFVTKEEEQEALNRLMGRKPGSKGRFSDGVGSYSTEIAGLGLDSM